MATEGGATGEKGRGGTNGDKAVEAEVEQLSNGKSSASSMGTGFGLIWKYLLSDLGSNTVSSYKYKYISNSKVQTQFFFLLCLKYK